MAMPSAPDDAASSKTDVLLLAAAEPCDAHAELATRLSRRMDVDARVLPFGTRADGALAALLSRAPARVVAVPISSSGSDPMLAELAGLLRWARTRWPDAPILLSDPLGTRAHVVGWAVQQVRTVLAARAEAVRPAETAVLVVGSGGASPEMNAEVCAIGRLLWERGDYAWVEAAFVHDAGRPSLASRIERCRQPGVERVVVVPLALLEGPTVRAVRTCVQTARALDVVVTGPLLGTGAAAAVVRQRYHDTVARWLGTGDDGLAFAHGHDHGEPAPFSTDDLLPPRYRGGRAASAVPMRSASLRYDAEGRVAWGEVWQSFCDLALAGGPPHRGTLLEPALREEVQGAPESYARVVAEIARGLSLITHLPVVTDGAPGWVGLVCPDEEMAIWMLRAITVENVAVRREGTTLFLPAGPRFRVEKEIKNVITAVAKTHHYWTEHRAAR